MLTLFVILLGVSATLSAQGQGLFGDDCVGTWQGRMYIYRHGRIQDSVSIIHQVDKSDSSGVWLWHTDYLSTQPVRKHYILRLENKEKETYIIDEGGGVSLSAYRHGQKLISIFETQGLLLTASYTLQGKELIFEVTSGRKSFVTGQEIMNYSVDVLQSVILTKSE